MDIELKNQHLTLRVKTAGAEAVSLKNNKNGREILWTADPTYWDEHSPILFPCVGRNWNEQFLIDGKAYPMKKHGFLKDMDFQLMESGADWALFTFQADKGDNEGYPFNYSVSVRYELKSRVLRVTFLIENQGQSVMPFMLGAHPGFLLPGFAPDNEVYAYLQFFDGQGQKMTELVSTGVLPYGFAMPETTEIKLEDGTLSLCDGTFACDTILERRDLVRRILVMDNELRPLQALTANSPVLGIWSPCNGRAPFVCVEPWWGSCDDYESSSEFIRRPFVQTAPPNGQTILSYSIEVLD